MSDFQAWSIEPPGLFLSALGVVSRMPSVLIADDHELIRIFLRRLIASQLKWTICGEAATGTEAVALALQHHPDIVVLDISMSVMNGVESTLRILRALPKTEVMIFSMHSSKDMIRKVVSAGARGFVLKSDAIEHIKTGLEALAEHKPYYSPEISDVLLSTALTPEGAFADNDVLTVRETQVLRLLAEGKSNKSIASHLNLSAATVQTHRTTVMRKLKINSFAALVRYAVRNRLVEP